MNTYNAYETIQSSLMFGGFKLEPTINIIKDAFYHQDITEPQRDQLIELAREKATPEKETTEEEHLRNLQSKVAEIILTQTGILARLDALESAKDNIEPTEPEVDVHDFPEWHQPIMGAVDAYRNGYRLLWNGTKYVCVAPEGYAHAYTPEVYAAVWMEYDEWSKTHSDEELVMNDENNIVRE